MTTARDRVEAWVRAAASGLDWAFREASRGFPRALRQAGTRTRLEVRRPRADGRPVQAGTARQSWLGHWQVEAGSAPGRSGRLVLLSPRSVLRRRFVLGPAAAAHAGEAVAHRITELCPIPPGEAIWSWRALGPAPDGGCEIEIAIARREEAEACLGAAQDGPALLAADIGEDGPVHVLLRRPAGRARPAGLLLAGAVLALAFAAWAAGWRLDRDIAALEAGRERLLAESRALRAEAEAAEALQPVLARQRAYPDLDDLLRAIEAGTAALPPDQDVGGIVAAQRELTLVDPSPAGGVLVRQRIGADR